MTDDTKKTAAPKKRTMADVKPPNNFGNTSFGKSKTKGGAPAKSVVAKPMRKASSKGR